MTSVGGTDQQLSSHTIIISYGAAGGSQPYDQRMYKYRTALLNLGGALLFKVFCCVQLWLYRSAEDHSYIFLGPWTRYLTGYLRQCSGRYLCETEPICSRWSFDRRRSVREVHPKHHDCTRGQPNHQAILYPLLETGWMTIEAVEWFLKPDQNTHFAEFSHETNIFHIRTHRVDGSKTTHTFTVS